MVGSCTNCLEFQNQQRPEPLQQHHIPDSPWEKVGIDVFHLYGKHYVIVVDYTSKYFDISQMKDCHSSTVVTHTKQIFSKFGIPKEDYSDNGPEFYAVDYKDFSKQWDFYHNTSIAEYPQSNGCVERMIQTVKKTLKKSLRSGDDPYLALLSLRTTPLHDKASAPATILFNRKIRTTLPSMHQTNMSVLTSPRGDEKEQRHMLPPLNVGDTVRLHDRKTWSQTTCTSYNYCASRTSCLTGETLLRESR